MEYFAYFGIFVTAVIVVLLVVATVQNYRYRKRKGLSDFERGILEAFRRD